MKQSRIMSLVESVANVIVGYNVAVVSIARSFDLRRLFETIRAKQGIRHLRGTKLRFRLSGGAAIPFVHDRLRIASRTALHGR